jgi:DNA-binding transcriptional MerR regulator
MGARAISLDTATPDQAEETYTITELAGEFGVTTRAIRFYEDKGLISPRRNGLNRVYSRRDRGRLKLVLRGKRLGFSLADIREMLDLYDVGDGQREQLKLMLVKVRERLSVLHRQREDIDDAIAELEDGQRQIEKYLKQKR